jgi:hypothetical protein
MLFETTVNYYQTTRHHIPEDKILHSRGGKTSIHNRFKFTSIVKINLWVN